MKISNRWLDLFALLPQGYDPVATAGEGDWFDVYAAEQPIAFFAEVLHHAKGPSGGDPFVLQPWQQAVTGCLFGWKRADGVRRYREALIYVAKKNGKTAWVAGILLYLLVADGELGAELYSAAGSRDQAGLIFQHAAGMVRQEPELRCRLKVLGDKGGSVVKSIVYYERMGSYKCLSADADTADGVNPSGVVIDELHRHKKPELSQVLQKSCIARRQPLVLYATTADYDRPSICNDVLKYARAVIENGGDPERPGYDPSFLPVIYEAPRFNKKGKPIDYTKPANFQNPTAWRAANPNLGVTVQEDELARQARKAEESPTELIPFLRLNLNVVTKSNTVGIRMDRWDACGGPIDVAGLGRRPCIGAMDLGATSDLTVFQLLYRTVPLEGLIPNRSDEPPSAEPEYDALYWFWCPREKAIEAQRKGLAPYEAWARAGLIELTDGDEIDYAFIRRRIQEIVRDRNVLEIAADRQFQGAQLCQDLVKDGFDVVPFAMSFFGMTAPSVEYERLINRGLYRHGGHPIARWMATNLAWRQDPAAPTRSIRPVKASPDDPACKIDAMVTGIMAVGRWISRPDTTSCYERRGLRTL